MAEKSPGKIITFYSYKGGTGRSMALANVAWIIACQGKKVLAIDWDLEAPGLHRYFYPFLIDKELSASDGVIDFVINYCLEAVAPSRKGESESNWYLPHANITRYAVSLNHEFPLGGRLDFVPAGRQGLPYAPRVNSFDWHKFYERLGGGHFLEEAKRQMREEYDYILVDSRTGVSDTSGICTIQMPDILVPCFTMNNQGIYGALNVVKTVFEQRKESGLRVFPVPMRLDNAENEKLERRSKEAQNKYFPFPNHLSEGDWQSYWDNVPVFYVPYYSYEEVLAVFAQGLRANSILTAAETLTKYLTNNEVKQIDKESLPSPNERERVLALYAGQPIKIDLEAELNQVAENAMARLSAEERKRARRVVQRLVRVARNPVENGDTRHRIPIDSFSRMDRPILNDLRDSRVLIFQADSATGKQTVQIAQDELLQGWKSLRQWLDDDRPFLIWLSEFRTYLENWQKAKSAANEESALNPDDLLLDGDGLKIARQWLQDRPEDIYPAERDFIEKSRRKHEPETAVQVSIEPKKYRKVPPRESANVTQAQAILRGQHAEPREMLELAKKLKSETRFSYARRLLLRASRHDGVTKDKKLRLTICQQLALCTYKDQDLPADERLERSLEILNEVEDPTTTINQETLGLLGSIYKRRWEIDNQRQNLERSLHYYLRGYEQGPAQDQGYTGINAAFVLDQLASLEKETGEFPEKKGEKGGQSPQVAEQHYAQAQRIRQDIISQVGVLVSDPSHKWVADKWWYYTTLAEAHFGLREYDAAVQWLKDGQAAAGEIYEWELETCARQLAALARMQDGHLQTGDAFEDTPAWAALKNAFGARAIARTAFVGKIGLALSGGGFRASLYHLGVLARLAELDVLRSVEVLSCVSGGSIVGAYYYLMVRRLLHTKTEDNIKRQDYIDIVHTMINEFVPGVQKNIRTRVVANPINNLRMFWQSDYSRTKRAGELYEQLLYSQIADGEEHSDRWLNEMTISPLTRGDDQTTFRDKEFAPKYQNSRRDAKVPILVLNAATLNTGHTWQFTTSWMGESPAGIDSEIDGNDRLRRMYYADAPKPYQRFRLGDAVGASAAVPGIFEPLTLDRLYPDRIVRLVDGGVCDNQGIASLLEQDCRVLLVSDASGQMEAQAAVSRNIFGVLLRTNNIFQARIRAAEYHDLKARRRSGLLRGLLFVHLKGDLDVDPVDWIGCQDPFVASDDTRPPSRRGQLTRYGIAKEIQELLSGVRTDLDSFSDAEAYALMTSGYRMTEYHFKYGKCVDGFSEPPQGEKWKFLQIEDFMKGRGEKYEYLKRLLTASSSIAFKVWRISPLLKYTVLIAELIAVGVVATVLYMWWDKPLPAFASNIGTNILNWLSANIIAMANQVPQLTMSKIAFFLVSLFGGFLLLRLLTSLVSDLLARNIVRLVRWKDTLRRVALATIISTIGWVAAVIHLWIFDKMFLRLGSIDTVSKKQDT